MIETTISFDELNLDSNLIDSLRSNGLIKASPVQEQTIPLILDGKDVFALAKTGSGKTAAFAIPILQKIISEGSSNSLHLVLSPTRELAQQTHKTFELYGKALGINSVSVIGGESYQKQKELLGMNSQIIVGTPGRVIDLVKQKNIDNTQVTTIVFDEADRLFDMGFKKEIEFLLKKVPQTRQLIMVSATTNMDVLRTAYRFHSHPEEINVSKDGFLVEKIDHNLVMLSQDEKFPYLVNKLRQIEDAYAIVFCNTQIRTHEIAEWLKAMKFKASPISGKLAQNKRTRLMESFRSKETTILVCTDVAARGLDIKNVNLVVNYDMPNEAANYVHRIGRTGRAGQDGHAISLCAFEDCDNLEAIYKVINAKIPRVHAEDDDFATDICPMPKIDRKSLRLESEEKKVITKERPKKTNKPKIKESKIPMKQVKKESEKPMTFNITSQSLQTAQNEAMKFFEIKDSSLLHHIVLSRGKKKFFFFGPQEVTYEFTVKNTSEDLIKTFFVTLIDKMKLNVFVTLKVNNNVINVDIKGDDIGMFLANRKQLLQSVETVARQFIQKSSGISSETRLYVNAIGTNPKPQKSQTSEDQEEKRSAPKKNNNRRPQNKNQNSEKWLRQLALKLKDEAISSGKEQATKPLNPAERRIIHQTLQDFVNVSTSSIGEGRLKRVLISLER